jgi:hypothetical protein
VKQSLLAACRTGEQGTARLCPSISPIADCSLLYTTTYWALNLELVTTHLQDEAATKRKIPFELRSTGTHF